MNLIPEREPYQILLDDIRLQVGRRVFPPDFGRTTRNMARVLERYTPRAALDMGCGTGYLALVLKRNGAEVVYAVDIDPLAVDCAHDNVERNGHLKPVTVVQSDLFTELRGDEKFDLMVFHQPYFPARGDEYIGGVLDGGYEIIRRFLLQAPTHLNGEATVIMAFQDTAGAEHDPQQVAAELGLSVRTVFWESEGAINRRIYEIRFPNQPRKTAVGGRGRIPMDLEKL